MQVDLLCSGSKGNACLVRTKNTTIMIDCGPSTWKYMKNSMIDSGVEPEGLDALLITHSHADHIRQLSHFAYAPIYACCPLSVRPRKGKTVSLNIHAVTPPQRLIIGELRILAIPTSHDSGPSMGFVIEGDGEKLVYITDTGYIPESLDPVISNADYYIFESNHDLEKLNETNRPVWLKIRIASDTGHLCNQDAARILCNVIGERTKRIVLAHLSEEANTADLALRSMYERLEYTHHKSGQLIVQAAEQFEPIRFGSLDPEGAEEPEQTVTQSSGAEKKTAEKKAAEKKAPAVTAQPALAI